MYKRLTLYTLTHRVVCIHSPCRYKSLGEIKSASLVELSELCGVAAEALAEATGWPMPEQRPEPEAPSSSKVKLLTPSELADPLRQLEGKFVVGDIYYEKAEGKPLYELKSLNADFAVFESIRLGGV